MAIIEFYGAAFRVLGTRPAKAGQVAALHERASLARLEALIDTRIAFLNARAAQLPPTREAFLAALNWQEV